MKMGEFVKKSRASWSTFKKFIELGIIIPAGGSVLSEENCRQLRAAKEIQWKYLLYPDDLATYFKLAREQNKLIEDVIAEVPPTRKNIHCWGSIPKSDRSQPFATSPISEEVFTKVKIHEMEGEITRLKRDATFWKNRASEFKNLFEKYKNDGKLPEVINTINQKMREIPLFAPEEEQKTRALEFVKFLHCYITTGKQ